MHPRVWFYRWGEEQPDSGVDFLMDLPRGYDLFTQRIPLTERLADSLHS